MLMKFTICRGGKLEFRDEHGQTALHCAAMKGHITTTKYLTNSGALMSARTDGGDTALHLASLYQHLLIVQFLVEKVSISSTLNEQIFCTNIILAVTYT